MLQLNIIRNQYEEEMGRGDLHMKHPGLISSSPTLPQPSLCPRWCEPRGGEVALPSSPLLPRRGTPMGLECAWACNVSSFSWGLIK